LNNYSDRSSVDEQTIERAARMYRTNKLAGAALGIGAGSFSRLCRKYNITTPHRRRQMAARQRHR
jgi:hypothetical protein